MALLTQQLQDKELEMQALLQGLPPQAAGTTDGASRGMGGGCNGSAVADLAPAGALAEAEGRAAACEAELKVLQASPDLRPGARAALWVPCGVAAVAHCRHGTGGGNCYYRHCAARLLGQIATPSLHHITCWAAACTAGCSCPALTNPHARPWPPASRPPDPGPRRPPAGQATIEQLTRQAVVTPAAAKGHSAAMRTNGPGPALQQPLHAVLVAQETVAPAGAEHGPGAEPASAAAAPTDLASASAAGGPEVADSQRARVSELEARVSELEAQAGVLQACLAESLSRGEALAAEALGLRGALEVRPQGLPAGQG